MKGLASILILGVLIQTSWAQYQQQYRNQQQQQLRPQRRIPEQQTKKSTTPVPILKQINK